MKNVFKVFAILAIIGFLAACSNGDNPPPTHTHELEEQPVATTYDLTLGDIKITLHYKKKPSEPVPAYVDRIQNRLTSMAGNPANTLKDKLKERNGNYSINVIYDGTPFDGFLATDGQTIKAHNTWLTANATTIESADISDGFNAMLALPPLDENGVPYYGTLPNTTIKIYKGDATITDTQMTTVIARIQTSYTDGITAGNFEADFQRIIKSIRVTLGANIVKNDNIIEFGCDAIEEYPGLAFSMIAMGETTGW